MANPRVVGPIYIVKHCCVCDFILFLAIYLHFLCDSIFFQGRIILITVVEIWFVGIIEA